MARTFHLWRDEENDQAVELESRSESHGFGLLCFVSQSRLVEKASEQQRDRSDSEWNRN
jgi:hypothetical protein